MKKNSDKYLCSKIPANSLLFTRWFLFKCVLLSWSIPTLQDNESRFYFCSLPRLVQQAKCLKIKGKEDIDLDNLFRGKNKNTSKNTDYTFLLWRIFYFIGFTIPLGNDRNKLPRSQEICVLVPTLQIISSVTSLL